MPFKRVGNDDYTSPSGRHFNQAQVRLYYAHGGKFPGQSKATGGPVMPALPRSIAEVRSAAAAQPASFGPAPPPLPPLAGGAVGGPPPAAPAPARGTVVTPPAGGGGMPSLGDATGTVPRLPQASRGAGYAAGGPVVNKGYRSSSMGGAKGGGKLERSRSFAKTPDQFSGGRMPTKESAPSKQAYGK